MHSKHLQTISSGEHLLALATDPSLKSYFELSILDLTTNEVRVLPRGLAHSKLGQVRWASLIMSLMLAHHHTTS